MSEIINRLILFVFSEKPQILWEMINQLELVLGSNRLTTDRSLSVFENPITSIVVGQFRDEEMETINRKKE